MHLNSDAENWRDMIIDLPIESQAYLTVIAGRFCHMLWADTNRRWNYGLVLMLLK